MESYIKQISVCLTEIKIKGEYFHEDKNILI